MPMRAPRICSCGHRVPGGATCSCQRVRKAEADKRRPTAVERGYGVRWAKARAIYLPSHPACVMVIEGRLCGQPATTVDHVVPHRGDMAIFWDKEGWQALCTHCHSSRKQSVEKQAGGAGNDISGASSDRFLTRSFGRANPTSRNLP